MLSMETKSPTIDHNITTQHHYHNITTKVTPQHHYYHYKQCPRVLPLPRYYTVYPLLPLPRYYTVSALLALQGTIQYLHYYHYQGRYSRSRHHNITTQQHHYHHHHYHIITTSRNPMSRNPMSQNGITKNGHPKTDIPKSRYHNISIPQNMVLQNMHAKICTPKI